MTTAYNWPRLYLLNLYRDAVECGHIVVEGLTRERAESLKMATYRLRRRSDASNKTMILPEYHLVTFGEWRETEAPLGNIAILYNTIPESEGLPIVRNLATGLPLPSAAARSVQPLHLNVLPPQDFMAMPLELSANELEVKPADISDFVKKLRDKATNHG